MSTIYLIEQDKKLSKQLLLSVAVVILAEILVTIYSFLGLFEVVPITVPIFFLLLIILLLVNFHMFALVWKKLDKVEVRTAIALIIWFGMVVGYWIFAPIYYLISMHFDAVQFRWVVFAFVWEVPLIGGMFMMLAIFLFRPIHRFLEGKSKESAEDIYKRINFFPVLVGMLIVVIVVFGYAIGTMQQKYFANMSPVEQWKNVIGGAITALLVGAFLSLLIDLYFNKIRFYMYKKYEFSTKHFKKITSKIIIFTMIIIIAGMGMSTMLSFKSAQNIVRQMAVEQTIDDLDKFTSHEWLQVSKDVKDKEMHHLKKGQHGSVFIANDENLNKLKVLDKTRDYIRNNQSGVIDDYQFNLKTIIFNENPNSGEKIVVVLYMMDWYGKIGSTSVLAFLGWVFILVTTGMVILFFKNAIAKPIILIQKKISEASSDDFQTSELATGDEFEELSDAITHYKKEIQQANIDLKVKVEEQTGQLSQQLSEIKKKNAVLEDTKKAVINILEDAQEIEIELKKNNEELSKFKLAAENANEHILITDENGKIIYANDAVTKITGYSKNEVLGKTPALWGGLMPKKFYKDMWTTIKVKKKTFLGEITNERKNGERYIASAIISPILDENKKVKFFVGLERDITVEKSLMEDLKKEKEGVEKKVEERTHDLKEKTKALESAKDEISRGWIKLQEEKARLLASINSLPAGFILTDSKENIILTNINVDKILGKEGKWSIELIEKKLAQSNSLSKLLKLTLSTSQVQEVKEINYEEKIIRLLVLPIAIQNTTDPIGAAILIEDITEAKILERSKDEFFSIASHELRTPLTSIRGNTSLIQQYYGEKLGDQSLKEMIQDIYDSSTRLIDIVNDFLDVSRIEQGRLEYKIAPFNIAEVIESVVNDLQASSAQKKITVSFKKPTSHIPKALADKDRVKQIIYNLGGNAIKFTEKGGVTISVGHKKDILEVRVMDSGRGIPKESQSLLFHKFQQASNNLFTRDTTRGTGLGLYISKMLANAMKGDLVLEESVAKKGSTFLLTIPIAK